MVNSDMDFNPDWDRAEAAYDSLYEHMRLAMELSRSRDILLSIAMRHCPEDHADRQIINSIIKDISED